MDWNWEEAISYYRTQGAPNDQSALISLLREIQHNYGSIPQYMPERIAQVYQIKESLILALIKRIPSLHLENVHCLEICAGPNCSKANNLARYAERAYAASGKGFALKISPCMRMCGKGPNLKWNGRLYHNADEVLLRNLLEESGMVF